MDFLPLIQNSTILGKKQCYEIKAINVLLIFIFLETISNKNANSSDQAYITLSQVNKL